MRKLSTSMKWMHYADISGTGGFPIDMLRYDNCIPASEEDANTIERVCNPMLWEEEPKWTVRVKKYSDLKSRGYWTSGRWNSFGCVLIEVAGSEYA